MGPWRAAERWIKEVQESHQFQKIKEVDIHLYGSLSLTGKGHTTDLASILSIFKRLNLNQERSIDFELDKNVHFHNKFLPFHPNGIRFTGLLKYKKKPLLLSIP